jgi:TatA/E family protein of Tat protein translocase
MQAMSGASIFLALLNLGGGEIVLILAVIFVLFGSNHLPLLTRGVGRAIREFYKAANDVTVRIDQEAHDAGRSFGGIYGKTAVQAITADNHVAELYDPAVFGPKRLPGRRSKRTSKLLVFLGLRVFRYVRSLLGP